MATGSEQGESRIPSGQPSTGSVVAGYSLRHVLRSRPERAVYLADDPRSGKPCVVKWAAASAHAGRVSPLTRLRAESDALKRVDHAGVVGYRDYQEDDSGGILVVEFVDGPTLETAWRGLDGPPREDSLRALLNALCPVVEAVHEAGVIHRDLKPDNIVLRPNGAPVLIDFGASESADGRASGRESTTPVSGGYAAPECYETDGEEGPWTDIYALGAIAYRAIAGQPPTEARMSPSSAKTRERELLETGRCSEGFARLVAWALDPKPGKRPRSVAAWRRVLAPESPATESSPSVDMGFAHGVANDIPPTEEIERTGGEAEVPGVGESESVPAEGYARRARAPWIMLAIFMVLAAGWFLWPIYQNQFQSEWVVDATGAGDASTIGEAVARAPAGANLRVRAGTYAEVIHIDRPLNIFSDTTDLEAAVVAPPAGSCLIVRARWARISGLRFKGAPRKAPGSPPCVDIADGDVLFLDNEIIGSPGTAVRIRGGARVVISGNLINHGAGVGILVTGGGSGKVSRNRVFGVGGNGVVLRQGTTMVLSENRIEAASAAGVLIAEGARPVIDHNRISGSRASAIEVRSGADPHVVGNTIADTRGAGIFVSQFGRGTYEKNEIAGGRLSGVVLSSGAEANLFGNLIRGHNEHGILAAGNVAGVVRGNTISGNTGHAIVAVDGAEVVAENNETEGNKLPQVLGANAP